MSSHNQTTGQGNTQHTLTMAEMPAHQQNAVRTMVSENPPPQGSMQAGNGNTTWVVSAANPNAFGGVGINIDGRISPNKCRPFTITQLDYGYEVKVGCQTLAIENKETLYDVIAQYLADPTETEKLYRTGELFKKRE